MELPDFQVVEIYVSPGHDYWVERGASPLRHGITRVTEVECVVGRGLRGDRYFGGRLNGKGQVKLMSLAVIEEIREEFHRPDLPASVFRRNLIVQGPPLSEMLERRFSIQGIEFEGSQECKPCVWLDRMVAVGAKRFMSEHFRGGLRARILRGGILTIVKASPTGDTVAWVIGTIAGDVVLRSWEMASD